MRACANRSIVIFALLAGLPSMLRAQAAVTWGSPTIISGDTDVSTAGTLVFAYKLTHDTTGNLTTIPAPPASVTVNGVVFTTTPYTTDFDGGHDKFSTLTTVTFGNPATLYAQDNAFTDVSAPFSGLSASYQSLLESGTYWNGANGSITLNNLTPGQNYQVQLWAGDPRAGTTNGLIGRNTTLNDDFGHAVTINLNDGSTTGGGSVGQYVTGTFTASGSTQLLNILLGPGGDSAVAQINALQLSAVPEPSTYAAIAAIVALIAAAFRRRRQLARETA